MSALDYVLEIMHMVIFIIVLITVAFLKLIVYVICGVLSYCLLNCPCVFVYVIHYILLMHCRLLAGHLAFKLLYNYCVFTCFAISPAY
jgi:hypothetical protein